MNAIIRASALAAASLMLALAAGCTVRPLLASSTPGMAGVETAALSSVAVNPVDTRYAQEVRNHLIFLFGGGAGQPAAPRYTLDLGITRVTTSAVQVQVGDENEPTAGTVTMTGTYRLTDVGTGQPVAEGRRQVSSAFDRPRQEYAVLRAARDAEDRAARELAELIRLAVAQDIVRLNPR